jgi:hypothetical protein
VRLKLSVEARDAVIRLVMSRSRVPAPLPGTPRHRGVLQYCLVLSSAMGGGDWGELVPGHRNYLQIKFELDGIGERMTRWVLPFSISMPMDTR